MKSIEDKEYQKNLLEQEGIMVSDGYKINLEDYLWKIDSIENIK